jgi:GDP-L-fucose synthase
MEKDSKILITGGTGMVGHALQSLLKNEGYKNVVAIGSKHCDLKEQFEVEYLFKNTTPDYIFHLAAQVYGTGGNVKFKSDVLYNNAMININVIEFARRAGVKKIVAMGSGCIYPELEKGKELSEEQIWLGEPHKSEDAYAHSKRFMLAQLQAAKEQYGLDYAYAVSGNLYGEYDNFDVEHGHVIPVLIAKFFNAKLNGNAVYPWGSGIAIRDFSYGEDTARTLLLLMQKVDGTINIGSGFVRPIKDIVDILQKITGVNVKWDNTKSDGQLERFYNLDKLKALGFTAKVDLEEGIRKVYEWYVKERTTNEV